MGTIVGCFIGMMFAPKDGKKMRLCFLEWLKGIDSEFQEKVSQLEKEIIELDHEKNLNNAKVKAETILKKSNDSLQKFFSYSR